MLHTGSMTTSDFILRNGIFTVVLELYVCLLEKFSSKIKFELIVAAVDAYGRSEI